MTARWWMLFWTPLLPFRLPNSPRRLLQHLLLLPALYRITFVPSGFPQTTDLQLTMNGIADRRDLLMKNRKTILLPFRLSPAVDSVSPDKIYSCWFYGSHISNTGNMCFITYLYWCLYLKLKTVSYLQYIILSVPQVCPVVALPDTSQNPNLVGKTQNTITWLLFEINKTANFA